MYAHMHMHRPTIYYVLPYYSGKLLQGSTGLMFVDTCTHAHYVPYNQAYGGGGGRGSFSPPPPNIPASSPNGQASQAPQKIVSDIFLSQMCHNIHVSKSELKCLSVLHAGGYPPATTPYICVTNDSFPPKFRILDRTLDYFAGLILQLGDHP